MENIDIPDIQSAATADKSKWKCIKSANGSIYYGEIGYVKHI